MGDRMNKKVSNSEYLKRKELKQQIKNHPIEKVGKVDFPRCAYNPPRYAPFTSLLMTMMTIRQKRRGMYE